MTHIPTGIVVQCQSDHSQHKNRAQAESMLRARLYEHELQKREAAAQAEAESKTDIGWGPQIRSYVLKPRSDARRVGQGGARSGRSLWSPNHSKKKIPQL